MRITIITPLFPPDASPTAKYVKQLASRISVNNDVTVLHYGRLPEQVVGVAFLSIPKRLFIAKRLWRMFAAILKVSKQSDVILLQNGPSIELPMLLATFIKRTKVIYMITDQAAQKKVATNYFQNHVSSLITSRSTGYMELIDIDSLIPPVIHPLDTADASAQTQFQAAWRNHIQKLTSLYSS